MTMESKRSHIRRVWLLLLFAAPITLAQGTLEVISLQHRTAEQVIPVLRPLLEPGGAMTGQSSQLIVRTSAENLAQIRAALAAIDRPLRRLEISVRFDSMQDAASRDARSLRDERVDQRMQVLEGGQAYIASGQSRTYSQAETGFAVIPRISGSQVFLDIGAQQEAYMRGGAVQGQRAFTTASGRLGEWIELGGASNASSRVEGAPLSPRERSATGERRVWVRVEEVR